MSGIYIPGMEKPTSCSNCVLCACYKESKGAVYRCDITMRPVKYFEVRLDNCPLVPVPEHGDLIDRDETVKTLAHDYAYAAADIVRNEIPTIIPAEEGER